MAVEWKRIVRYSFWSKIIFHFSSPKRKNHWFDKEKNSELNRKWSLFWRNSENNYWVSRSKRYVFLKETLAVAGAFTDSEKTFPFEMLPARENKRRKNSVLVGRKTFFPRLSDENRVSRTYRKKKIPISEKVDIERCDSKQNLFQKHKMRKTLKNENFQNQNPGRGLRATVISVHHPCNYIHKSWK